MCIRLLLFFNIFLFIAFELNAQEKKSEDATEDTPQEIKALIDQLASDDFSTREKATAKLIESGEVAYKYLPKYTNTNDAEQKWRIDKIIKDITFSNVNIRNNELEKKLKNKLNSIAKKEDIENLLNVDREFWYFLTDILGPSYKINILCSNSFGEKEGFKLKDTSFTGKEIIQMIKEQLECESRIVNGFLTFGTKEELDIFEKNLETFKTLKFNYVNKISLSPVSFIHKELHFEDWLRKLKDLELTVSSPSDWRTYHCWTVVYIYDEMPFELAFKTVSAFLNYNIKEETTKEGQPFSIRLEKILE